VYYLTNRTVPLNNYVAESNAILTVKFKRLHLTLVHNLYVPNIIDFLFQEGVIGHRDVRALQRQINPQQQCRDLLMLLHSSQHPEAFVQLYRAISNDPSLQWLVECVDELHDQSLINAVQQQRYLGEPTGKCGVKLRRLSTYLYCGPFHNWIHYIPTLCRRVCNSRTPDCTQLTFVTQIPMSKM